MALDLIERFRGNSSGAQPDAAPDFAHTATIAEGAQRNGAPESERLARRWFALAERGSFDELVELVAEDVVVVSKLRAGATVEGRQQYAEFLLEEVADNLFEAMAEVYRPVDDERVVVEGRMRWIDDDRVIRDDPVVWAMEFRDGLLLRFVPARTAVEAERILAAR